MIAKKRPKVKKPVKKTVAKSRAAVTELVLFQDIAGLSPGVVQAIESFFEEILAVARAGERLHPGDGFLRQDSHYHAFCAESHAQEARLSPGSTDGATGFSNIAHAGLRLAFAKETLVRESAKKANGAKRKGR